MVFGLLTTRRIRAGSRQSVESPRRLGPFFYIQANLNYNWYRLLRRRWISGYISYLQEGMKIEALGFCENLCGRIQVRSIQSMQTAIKFWELGYERF